MKSPAGSAVGTPNIPGSIRALSSLPAIDYVDLFTLSTDADASPEQWARAMFGDVPSIAEQLIWRGLLGIRLSRGRSPATVAGWQIAECGDNWIRLEAASWFLTGNLVVRATDGQVSLVTFLRYDRRLAPLGVAPVVRRPSPTGTRPAPRRRGKDPSTPTMNRRAVLVGASSTRPAPSAR